MVLACASKKVLHQYAPLVPVAAYDALVKLAEETSDDNIESRDFGEGIKAALAKVRSRTLIFDSSLIAPALPPRSATQTRTGLTPAL